MYCTFLSDLYLEETYEIDKSITTYNPCKTLGLQCKIGNLSTCKTDYAVGQLDVRLSRTCVLVVFM